LKCDFGYCIYNEDFLCVLKKIQINSLGMCEECIIVTIEEKELEMMKERDLRALGYL